MSCTAHHDLKPDANTTTAMTRHKLTSEPSPASSASKIGMPVNENVTPKKVKLRRPSPHHVPHDDIFGTTSPLMPPHGSPITYTKKRKRERLLSSTQDGDAATAFKKVKSQSSTTHVSFKDVPHSPHSSKFKEKARRHEDNEQQCRDLVRALCAAQDELEVLKAETRHSESRTIVQEKQLRQQMLFDFVLKQDQLKKECDRIAQRHIKTAQIATSRLEQELQNAKNKLTEANNNREEERKKLHDNAERLRQQFHSERQKYLNALSTSNLYQSSLEHCQQLLKTAEEDLAELQRIHNEEKMLKEKNSRGLPPAYGSLDDEEVQQPWGRHEDGGTLDIAQVKHTIRDRFLRDLHNAQALSNAFRESQDALLRNKSGLQLYRSASLALQEACISLREIMDNADDVDTSPRSKKKQKRRQQSRTFEQQRREPLSRRAYIADRSAKLCIDLTWRLASIFDIRPCEVKLTATAKAEVGLYWRKVDDVFLEALQAALHATSPEQRRDENDEPLYHPTGLCPQCKSAECAGHCVRLNELQFFLTHVKSVSKKLDDITKCVEMRGIYFCDSWQWLVDCIEKERQLAASAAVPPTRPPSPCCLPPTQASAGASNNSALRESFIRSLNSNTPSRPQDDDTATVPDPNIDALAEQERDRNHATREAVQRLASQVRSYATTQHSQVTYPTPPARPYVPRAAFRSAQPPVHYAMPVGSQSPAQSSRAARSSQWFEVSRDNDGGTTTLSRSDGPRNVLHLDRMNLPPQPSTTPRHAPTPPATVTRNMVWENGTPAEIRVEIELRNRMLLDGWIRTADGNGWQRSPHRA